MGAIERHLARLKSSQGDMAFREVKQLCDHYFGLPRIRGSHCIYTMPWRDDPRVNIQNRKGRVAAYQVKQVARAIERWEREHEKG